VLGGCSSINGMIYMRGQAGDYDGWAAEGNPGWAWNDVLPLFKQSENHFAGAANFTAPGRMAGRATALVMADSRCVPQAAAQSGIASIDDFNQGDKGCGYFQVNQKAGVRWNAAKAFLKPIRQRPNLTVLTGVEVDRVLLENGRACKVSARQQGQVKSFKARKEIILCAGAVGSPGILQRSGIGPRPLLERLGIGVRHELPGVGGNLQDHLQLRLIYKLQNARTLNQIAGSLWGKMGMGLRYLYDRSGPLSMAPSQLGAFARSGRSRLRPTLNTTCNRCRWSALASRCTASRRSPRRSATCARRAVGVSISARRIRRTRR
jgi:choline dehydrogenase